MCWFMAMICGSYSILRNLQFYSNNNLLVVKYMELLAGFDLQCFFLL